MTVIGLEAYEGPTQRAWRLDRLSPGLNVVAGDALERASAAGLLAHLVLGWRDAQDDTGGWREGQAVVRQGRSEATLRRRGEPQTARLTIASGTAPSGTGLTAVDPWRAGAPVEVIAEIFCPRLRPVDHALARLLSPRVATAIRNLLGSPVITAVPGREADDRSRLAAERDAIAARIETLLSERRRESATLEGTLREIDDTLDRLESELDDLRGRLALLDQQLHASESRARYAELARAAEQTQDRRAADDFMPRRDDLDQQIERWRRTLAELDRRQTTVRSELAQAHPTDARPEIALADQRACVAVAERLVADLESEVARFAHVSGAPHCVCADAHPRLNPLVETLGEHVARLRRLVGEQGAALRWQELSDEAERLDRSRSELRTQLDKLLERRETLLRTTRPRAEEPLRAEFDQGFDRRQGEVARAELATRLADTQAERDALLSRRTDLNERRTRLLAPAELADLQQQLAAAQSALADGGSWDRQPHRSNRRTTLRASSALAKLSDGDFRELHLAVGGRSVEVVTSRGQRCGLETLNPEQRHLVLWALRLALADACLAAGVSLPLIINEPFGPESASASHRDTHTSEHGGVSLSDRSAANLAMLLDDLRRGGAQVFLFTKRRAALDRFRSLGHEVRQIEMAVSVPAKHAAPVPKVVTPLAEAPPIRETAQQVVVAKRDTLLSVEDSVERFPVPLGDRSEVFSRSRIRTIGDLMFADPSAVAEEIDRDDVTPELVSLWQAHLSLVCTVPGLSLQDATQLTDAEIYSPEELAEADAEVLRQRLAVWSNDGSSSERIAGWIERALDRLSGWQARGYAERWARCHTERRERIRENANRRLNRRRGETGSGSTLRIRREERLVSQQGGSERADRIERRRRRDDRDRSERRSERSSRSSKGRLKAADEKPKGPRFYLELSDEIEKAPSIGPKRAATLTEIGIATVRQLLDADPAQLAEQLDDRRVDATVIVAWQHQASLVCRVPELRGHDAQVLVGSGFTTPEEIATMKPADLFEFVDAFCDTNDGQRALRGSSRPDLEEVGQWIAAARQRRVLGAA
ncbi:DUF4332 domain-containing protein [Botrimarina hoheduenensis]|uniref:Pathogenicity locus n=1 Tax=Botrimarina hoheduenensis TaxID=2528000 RepID=A0A5C5WDK9_9BACT|nr:DUF4332 domain-containing protein [Botrimarina hoheduenensis]TWT48720.1 Pathogenicity locus [Botrimarina hoheduenensis]